MKRQFEFMSRGYPYGTDILYVYCDKCGSFNIKKYIRIRKWLLITITLGIMVISTLTSSQTNRLYCIRFFLSLAICILAFKFLWGDTDYKCRKCRNTQIIVNKPKDLASVIPIYNTRNYPPDMGLIDVTDNLTQKRYQGYWDDEYQ